MLSRLSIASKLLLLLPPFFCALIFLASVLSLDRASHLRALQHSERLIVVAGGASQLIHDLQTERGLRNGFLSGRAAARAAAGGPRQRRQGSGRLRRRRRRARRRQAHRAPGRA
jgi:uncharacterized SAM-binding protein YcdF (DUF218 family)